MPEPATSQPSMPPVEPGTVLAGKYRVERIIGRGGMGVVVEARHIALDERVALKFLLPEFARHPEGAARFLREARAAVRIKSEHVARVTDVGTLEDGAPYMVMEFLVGSDLAHVLQEHGTLSIEDAVDYVVQGCEAIAEAHGHGIVHRDLKPANLFLTSRADGSPLVKVLDFGISKMASAAVDNLTRTTAALGSALYMSPEQMQQTRSVDHRTDIYALGVALFELLAGRPPYYAETLPQLCAEVLTGTPTPLRAFRPDAPQVLAIALERAYARDRDQRYASVAEFVIALAPFAPPRTHPTIDRIARMGRLATASPGASRGSSPAFTGADAGVPGAAGRAPSWPEIGAPFPPAPDPRAARPEPPPPRPPPAAPREAAVAPHLGGRQSPALPHLDGSRQSPELPHLGGRQSPALPHLDGSRQSPELPHLGGRQSPELPHLDGSRQSPVPGALRAADALSQQIVPGPYSAPMSARAAATFASGTTLGLPPYERRFTSSSTTTVIAVLSTAVVVGIIAGALALRQGAIPDASRTEGALPTAEAPASAPPAPAPELSATSTTGDSLAEPAIEPTVRAGASAAAPESSAAPPAASAAESTAPTGTPRRAGVTRPAPRTAPDPYPAPAPRPAPTSRPAPAPRPARSIDLNNPH